MKFITNLKLILATLLVAFGASAWAQDSPEVTMDFTGATNWGIPNDGTNKDETAYTYGDYTIKLASTTNYKQNSGYVLLGKSGSYLELPAFSFAVEKIEVEGTSGASTSVKQNIYVGEEAVSTETTGAKDVTNTYVIADGYQAAGTVYRLVVNSNHNTQIASIKIYKKAEGGVTVAKPVFTPTGGSFLGSQEVTITAEDGADIYYTVDGTTPTTESTKYTAAFAITETTTVKAIAVKGGVTSSEATATFTLIPGYSSILAVTALTNNDVFVFTGEALIVAKPTANHVYIQDETGSALLYDSTGEKTAAAEVGKTMAANWSGKVSIYKKLFEIVPDQAIAVKDGDAATVTYPEATAEDITLENVNKVVLLKGITSYSVDGKNLTITIGENEIAGYNQFGLEIAAAEDGKTYEMVGSISRYNDNAQFQPIEIKEEEPAPEKLFADGKYYLQNAYSFKYWGAGNSWGTQASLLEHPDYITLIGNEDGTYKMETQVENKGGHFFDGEYMDTNTPVNLTITKAKEVGENAVTGEPMYLYHIQNAADNLYYCDPGVEGQSLIKTTDFEGSFNAMWVIASEEEVLASLKGATVEDPVDATFLIADARFGRNNRNVSAWTNEGGAVLTGGNSNKHSAEKYRGVFNVYQTLANAPAGVYKFTAQGFYRQDGEDNEHLPVFYANEETSTFPAKTGSENDMATGCASFESGKYQAEPIFVQVTEAGALTVGAKLEGNTMLWCMWDNFALEYYGADADINALKFADYIAQVDELTKKATELKESGNVTSETAELLTQAIENTEDLQTADDYKTAIAALTAAISQAENDAKSKAAIDGMYKLIESTNFYTAEAYETYKGAADAYKAAWAEGTLTETVVTPYAVYGWHSANAYDDFLLSAWSIGGEQCKDFDKALYINTWSIEGEGDGSEFKVPFFEYWTGDDNSLGKNTLTGTVSGLTAGNYKVSAWIRVRAKNGYTAPAYGITMDVNGGEAVDVAAGAQIGTSQFYLAEFTAAGVVAEDGVLKVNINIAEDNNISWLSFQNVKYEAEAPAKYAISVGYGSHGVVSVDKTEAAEGELVTVTVTPDAGYKVDEASFSWGDGQELEFSIISETQGQFKMPAGNVNISFTFKRNYGSYFIAGNMTEWAVKDEYKMSSNKEVTEEAEEYTFTMDLTTASQFKVVKVEGETQTWIPDGMGNAFGENGEIKADGKYIIRFRPNADGGDDWFEKMITIESAEDPVIANYEFVASEWIAGDPGRISADNVVVNDKANTITVDKAGNNNVALLYKGKDYIVSADNRYFVIKATGLSTEEGKSYLWWLNNKNNGSQIAPNTIYDEDGVTVFAWDLMQVAIAGTLGTEETLFTNGSDWSTTFGMTLADEAVPAVISYIGFQTSIPQPVEEYEYAFDATLWVAGDPGRISADNVVVDVVANTITVDKSGNNNIALVYRTDKMYYVEGADYFVIQGTGLSTEEGKSYLWWLNGANNGTQVAPTFTKVDENGLVTFAWDIAASGIGASFNAAKTYLVGGEGWNTTFGLTLADEAVPAVISYIGFDKSDSDIMTGINGINANFANNGAIYDLTGRRVKNVVKGNLYIVNGKKVLVK